MNALRRLDPRRSLTVRIIFINLTLILLALGSLVFWTGFRLQRSIIASAESELKVRSLIIANGLREPVQQQLAYEDDYYAEGGDDHETESNDGEDGDKKDGAGDHTVVFAPIGDRDFKAIVDSFAREMNARVTILDSELVVRYSSDESVPLHLPDRRPETVAAWRQDESHDIRFDEASGEDRLFVAAPILGNEGVNGVVQLSVPMKDIQKRVGAMWLTLITAGLALTVLFVLASIFLGRQITRPLHRLGAAAHRLADGDFGTRLEMAREDELGVLAAAFDHMAEEISQLLARERAFVANASHELRSPVTSIQLRAELLEMVAADDARRERYIREIHQESENLGRLLQQLLDLDRAQSASHPADPIDIAPCLRKVCDLMLPLAEHAGLSMTVDIPPSLSGISLDARDCETVFRNLLDNAIKYTPAGGSVQVQARDAANGVEIVVRDTGMGIPAQDLPFIFDRFYRVDKARDRTGSGLGLALVKEIITQAGGEIRAESDEGQGAMVIVRLLRS